MPNSSYTCIYNFIYAPNFLLDSSFFFRFLATKLLEEDGFPDDYPEIVYNLSAVLFFSLKLLRYAYAYLIFLFAIFNSSADQIVETLVHHSMHSIAIQGLPCNVSIISNGNLWVPMRAATERAAVSKKDFLFSHVDLRCSFCWLRHFIRV